VGPQTRATKSPKNGGVVDSHPEARNPPWAYHPPNSHDDDFRIGCSVKHLGTVRPIAFDYSREAGRKRIEAAPRRARRMLTLSPRGPIFDCLYRASANAGPKWTRSFPMPRPGASRKVVDALWPLRTRRALGPAWLDCCSDITDSFRSPAVATAGDVQLRSAIGLGCEALTKTCLRPVSSNRQSGRRSSDGAGRRVCFNADRLVATETPTVLDIGHTGRGARADRHIL